MTHWKCTLTYDGTPFHGWQIQPNLATVQGTLARAIHRITGEATLPQGSGRTDAGVHALAQVASFSLAANIPATNLHRALNRALPASIRVLALEPVPESFHARHSALRKTYEYRLFPSFGEHICSPMLAPWVWTCPYKLESALMHAAAQFVVGTHDFTSFAASDPDLASRGGNDPREGIRTILNSGWQQSPEGLQIYRVTGSGFLHHMVRNLVGTFVEAGAGRIAPHVIPVILSARNRAAAGPTAPAQGLFLVQVDYPE